MNPDDLDPAKWTPERLQSLITDEVAEDFRLDFKGADSLRRGKRDPERVKKNVEVGRDTTAFANSDGGVLIYGIAENKSEDGRTFAGGFDPVSMSDVSPDTLIQVISSNSEPTLVGVRVFPVQIPDSNDPSKVCFVVVVPKSDTAHMAADGRYYYRIEATKGRMRDWQVRDAMNRKRHPDVSLKMRVLSPSGFSERDWTFHIEVTNEGTVMAKNFCGVVSFPYFRDGQLTVMDEAVISDLHVETADGLQWHQWEFSNLPDSPLFPGRSQRFNVKFQRHAQVVFKDPWGNRLPVPRSIDDIRITLFADEMPARKFVHPFEISPSVL